MRSEPRRVERRKFGRRPVEWQGEIRLPCRPPLPCTVKNTSPAGALLEFDVSVYVPHRFRLSVADRFETNCTVQHRAEGAVGVKFDTPMPESW